MVLCTTVAVLGTFTLLFYLFSKWRYQYWSRRGMPQLETNLIFGSFKPVFTGSKTAQDFLMDIYKDAKSKGLKHIGIYSLLSPEWMPLDLNAVKNIFLKDFDHFLGHGTYHHKTEPLTENLFSMEGEEWKKLRAKLTPTFTTGKMKMMFDTLIQKADVLHEVLNESATSGGEIPIKETLSRFGIDVIGSVAFGIECNSLKEPDNTLRKIGKKVFEPSLLKFLLEQLIPFNILAKLGYKTVHHEVSNYFTEVIGEAIRYRETHNIERKDFMQLMLQLKNQGNVLTNQEIITESFLFYLAGFETSSSATTFGLIELSQNQDIQDKLRQEILKVLEKYDGKITYDAIMEMEYLDKVIQEALRKYPPLAFIPRECSKQYKIPDTNIVIEKGTRVYIPAWGIQKDPEYYPNPEAFNPENFSPENKSKRPDYTWFPFGEGPRMCIGLRFGMMQSKVGLITLLKDYRISPHEKTKWPLEMDNGAVVLSVKGEVWLKIKKL